MAIGSLGLTSQIKGVDDVIKASVVKKLCEFCGCALDIEKEVFEMDKLFTGHSCRGSTTTNGNNYKGGV